MKDDDFIKAEELAELLRERREERKELRDSGVQALLRLCKVAQGGSGQCHHVRRFLLGLYNSESWPFELNRLRGLDKAIKEDCFTVLELDVAAYQEIHTYILNGGKHFKAWWAIEAGE